MIRWLRGAKTIPQTLYFAGAMLVASVAVILGATAFFRTDAPVPMEGRLDLRSWDFSRQAPVPLAGTWQFVPDRLVSDDGFAAAGPSMVRHVPDTRFLNDQGFFHGSGSGTYRLEILLPPGTRNLGLRYSTMWSAFEVEANGVVVAKGGTLGSATAPTRPEYVAGTAPLPPLPERLVLVVRVSNQEYRWGGIVQPLILGDEAVLAAQKRWNDLMVLLLVGTLVGIAANSLFLFAFRRRDLVNISFAAFAVMVALRALTSGDNLLTVMVPGLGFDAFLRLEYLSLYSLVPLAALFFSRLFPEDISRTEMLFVLPAAAFLLLVPFASWTVLSWSLLPYFFISFCLVTYGYVAACLRPAMRHRQGAGIVLTTGTVLWAAVLLNFHEEVLLAHAESTFPLGLTCFVIIQSLVMARRFTWAFETAESLTEELKEANRKLAEEAREAEDAKDGLEAALAEKDILLKEVHHRVKNSLQIVLSIINLQARRTKDPGALAAYSSVRDRIRAISSVHSRLFGLESEKRIDLAKYAKDLIQSFSESYADARAEFHFESEAIQVPMDLCLEIGLVFTELVLNAYSHAVMPAGGGVIRIVLHQDAGAICLRVADEGPGFPAGFVAQDVKTIGFRIILSMINQRGGSLSILPGPGAGIEVRFPLAAEGVSAQFTA